MNRQELAKRIYQVSYLTGSFRLRSGQTSTEYFDKYRFEAQPELLREIARALIPLIPPGTQILAGLEMGGIPIATALALETGLPVAFVRKEAKKYGTCQFAEGTEVKGKQVCVIEDVVTTGGQILLSTRDLRDQGAKISDVLCAIFRGDKRSSPLDEAGLKLHALFTMDELKSAGQDR